jgi:hypothetical protein
LECERASKDEKVIEALLDMGHMDLVWPVPYVMCAIAVYSRSLSSSAGAATARVPVPVVITIINTTLTG